MTQISAIPETYHAVTSIPRDVKNAMLRASFLAFLRKTFLTLNPGAGYAGNWHIEAICWHLEQVRLGKIKRLIITMPPRSLKSLSASIAFPAFVHGHDPSKQIICVSYSQDLASKFQNDYRSLIQAEWYKDLFPETRVGAQKNTENELMLTGRGTRLATSIGGTLTGRGADIIIIDDPLKPADAMSEPKRSSVNDWYSSTLLSRLDDKLNGAIVIVTQRVHADDLVGHILERSPDDWALLELPAIASVDCSIRIQDNRHYPRKAGDLLHPQREPQYILDALRRDLGTEAFNAQYLQCPAPPGGSMFKRSWLSYYDHAPPRNQDDEIIQSWDTASKTGTMNDYSVCTTWLVTKERYYLLDVLRGRYDYPELRSRAITNAEAWQPSRVLIEDTGVGIGLLAELRNERLSAIGIKPENSKEARASIITAKFEAGLVLFPKQALWLSDLEAELLAFPGGRHDDQVDSIVQALSYQIMRLIVLGLDD